MTARFGWNLCLIASACFVCCTGSRPFVTITAPRQGTHLHGTVAITAEIAGEHIARVEFYIDDEFHAIAMHPPYTVPWQTHVLPDSSNHVLHAKVYDLSGRMATSDPVFVSVDNSLYRPKNTLHLVSATMSNAVLNASDPRIEVEPGADITGDVVVRADNHGDPSWGAPLGGTPTWGDHIDQYWETGIWLPPGESEYTVDIFLQAPGDTGMYYIFLAWGHEADCSHVMALSYWRYENSPEWNDGHDIADWGEEQANSAIDSGYVRSLYRYDATGYGVKYVPAAAIRVHVIEPGSE